MAGFTTLEFYGSPCNYDWYEDLSVGKFHGDMECSIWFCSPKTFKNSQTVGGVTTRMFPEYVITNLECMSVSTYESENTTVLDDYVMGVASLVDCSMTDEIDPRGLENKIPAATFSFKLEGVSQSTSYDDIETILAKFDGKLIKIYRGYASHTGRIHDENGRYALDYYSDYTHDIVCMGNYILTKKEYNYEKQTFEFECENIFFHDFAEEEHYKALSRTNDATETAHLYQLYPYPYGSTYRQELSSYATSPMRTIDTHKLGYNIHEMLRSDIKYTFDTFNAPLYGCNLSGGEAYGVDTHNIVKWLWSDGETEPSRYCYTAQANPVSATAAAYTESLISNSADNPNRLVGLLNNWKSETAIESVNAFNIINNLRILPYSVLDYVPEESRTTNIVPGSWRTVGGYAPPARPLTIGSCFLDETASWSEDTQGTAGGTFPTKSDSIYYVTSDMLLSSSLEKNDLNWDSYNHINTYNVSFDLDGVSSSVITKNFKSLEYSLSQQDTVSGMTDLVSADATSTSKRPYPTNYNTTGFQSMAHIELSDDRWWHPTSVAINGISGVGVISYSETFDKLYSGSRLYPQATELMGQVALPSHDGYLDCFSCWWNTNLTFYSYQPFSFDVRYIIPSEVLYDINNTSTSEDKTSTIDSIHFHPSITGLPSRVLHKANYSDALRITSGSVVYETPTKELVWTMVDDPSLRVGTAVYIPFQNRYVRCYITKQERTFDGGARLKCTGVMFDALGQYGLPYRLEQAYGYYKATTDGSLHFEWKTSYPYDDSWTMEFEIWYEPSASGSSAYKIADVELAGVGSGIYTYDNDDVSSLEEEIGHTIDTDGSLGTYYVKGYAPYDESVTDEIDFYFYDATNVSNRHVGRIRASNMQQPMMPEEYLLG